MSIIWIIRSTGMTGEEFAYAFARETPHRVMPGESFWRGPRGGTYPCPNDDRDNALLRPSLATLCDFADSACGLTTGTRQE